MSSLWICLCKLDNRYNLPCTHQYVLSLVSTLISFLHWVSTDRGQCSKTLHCKPHLPRQTEHIVPDSALWLYDRYSFHLSEWTTRTTASNDAYPQCDVSVITGDQPAAAATTTTTQTTKYNRTKSTDSITIITVALLSIVQFLVLFLDLSYLPWASLNGLVLG